MMKRRKNISKQTVKVLQKLLEAPGQWHYGYDLMKATDLASGTVYPMLVRLNDQGLLEADWKDASKPGQPPRHVYRLTEEGLKQARKLVAQDIRKSTPVPINIAGQTT